MDVAQAVEYSEDDFAGSPAQRLDGHFYADQSVLNQLKSESKALPGKWSFIVGAAIWFAAFYGAFQNPGAALVLAALATFVYAADVSRRRDSIDARYRDELQAGMIRAVYAQTMSTREKIALDLERSRANTEPSA